MASVKDLLKAGITPKTEFPVRVKVKSPTGKEINVGAPPAVVDPEPIAAAAGGNPLEGLENAPGGQGNALGGAENPLEGLENAPRGAGNSYGGAENTVEEEESTRTPLGAAPHADPHAPFELKGPPAIPAKLRKNAALWPSRGSNGQRRRFDKVGVVHAPPQLRASPGPDEPKVRPLSLEAYARWLTNDGRDLIDYMRGVVAGEPIVGAVIADELGRPRRDENGDPVVRWDYPSFRARQEAAVFIARVIPELTAKTEVTVSRRENIDLSALTIEEKRTMWELISKVPDAPALTDGSDTTEAQTEEVEGEVLDEPGDFDDRH
jgi:hypothetical protein